MSKRIWRPRPQDSRQGQSSFALRKASARTCLLSCFRLWSDPGPPFPCLLSFPVLRQGVIMLLSLLVYGYATGVFSSRKIERATYDSVAFRFIAAGCHPDRDTLATFRRRFLAELDRLFVQVLELAHEMKRLKHRTADCHAPGGTSSELARAFHRTRRLAGGGDTGRKNGTSAQEQGSRPRGLRAQKTNHRAGVRHHQIGDGLPSVLNERIGENRSGMEAGLPGVESQTHGFIASSNVEKWAVGTKKATQRSKTMPFVAFSQPQVRQAVSARRRHRRRWRV